MLWPKKNSYKEFDNVKEFLRLENSSPLPPPPHNCSNGQSLTEDGCLREPCLEKRSGLIVFTELIAPYQGVRIPKSGKFLLVESEMRENFPVESGIQGFGIWNMA